MKLLHSAKDFQSALEKLCDINQKQIELKLENTLNNLKQNEPDLDILLLANDNEFKPLIKQHCNKSGKELKEYSLEFLKELITIHGKEKTIQLLKLDACQQYAPLWIDTSPDSLHKLIAFDTAGYFIYAASHIFHCDIVNKSNQLHSAPDSIVQKKKKIIPKTILEPNAVIGFDNLLTEFPEQDKPELLSMVEIPADSDIRFFNLQDKIVSRRNIEIYFDDVMITECNELLRRFLGLAKPEKAAKIVKFSFEHLYQVTESEETLKQFIQELKTAIKTLFENHYRALKRKKVELHHIELNKHKEITASDIATIKAKFNGLTNFHQQPKIRNQNKKDSILYDLRGFWDENIEKSDILKQFNAGGPSKHFDSDGVELDKNTKQALNRFTVKKGIKIKLKVAKDDN